MSYAQQFKEALLKGVNTYMSRFNDKKPMSLQRSQEAARIIQLLDSIHNPLELYKKAYHEYLHLKLSLPEQVLGISRSALRKELRLVFERFTYPDLLDAQVHELMKQSNVNAELEQENAEFKAAITELKDKLAKGEARIRELEAENTKLKAALGATESKRESSVLNQNQGDPVLQEKLQQANQTIQTLERRVTVLESQNAKLKENNQILVDKNLRLIKDKHDLRKEMEEIPVGTPSVTATSVLGLKLG